MVKTNDGKVWKRHVNQIHDLAFQHHHQHRVSLIRNVFVPPPQVSVESSVPDMLVPTGLVGPRCSSESVLNRENAQVFLPDALDAKNVMSPTGVSSRPNQEESVSMSPSCPVRPVWLRKRPQYLKDFVLTLAI